jgi:GxxExxY protein
MAENRIGTAVVDCAYRVHRQLGPGLSETVYEAAFHFDLCRAGFQAERQVAIPIVYNSLRFNEGFRADVVVNDLVIIELKSVEQVLPVHQKHLLTYLRLSEKRLGYLINFGAVLIKDGISRSANGVNDWRDDSS